VTLDPCVCVNFLFFKSLILARVGSCCRAYPSNDDGEGIDLLLSFQHLLINTIGKY